MVLRPSLAALAAALALAACDSKPANSVETANAEATAPAKKIELPPAIKSSKQYRCKDDSVVTVNLFQGDKMANVKDEAGPATNLTAEEAGKPLVAEGFELVVKGDAIALTRPGHPKQDCLS
jgi:hypothetical protein